MIEQAEEMDQTMLDEHRHAAEGQSGLPAGRIVLAGVGADAHSIGLTVLREALSRGGFDVEFLGGQQDLKSILRAAQTADAVLISNMDGHAKYYLEDLQSARLEASVGGQLWHLGGYPALNDCVADLNDLGFDRAFQGYVGADTVLRYLRDDLARRAVKGPEPRAGPGWPKSRRWARF